MKIQIHRIIEGIIVTVAVGLLTYLGNRLLSDKINILLVVAGFLLGIVVAVVIIKIYGHVPLLNLSRFFDQDEESEYSDAASLAEMVAGINSDSSKVETIRSIAPTIETEFSGDEIDNIVSTISSSSSIVDALAALAPITQRPISVPTLNRILARIDSDSSKSEAAFILHTGQRRSMFMIFPP